jgi:hypothetical protein
MALRPGIETATASGNLQHRVLLTVFDGAPVSISVGSSRAPANRPVLPP